MNAISCSRRRLTTLQGVYRSLPGYPYKHNRVGTAHAAAGSAGVDAVVVSLPYYFPINSAGKAYRWFAELVPKAASLVLSITSLIIQVRHPSRCVGVHQRAGLRIKDSGSEEAGIYDYIKRSVANSGAPRIFAAMKHCS